MNLNIKKPKNIEEIAEFISSSINRELQNGHSVLWFVSGGSAMQAEIEAANKIKEFSPGKLVISLADERYGLVGHSDSNWSNLLKGGLNVRGAKLIPFLMGKDLSSTTKEIRKVLKEELYKADYKIGVFGVGLDGHTAGILPHSRAIYEPELVFTHETELFDRITITPKAIEMLDEAILYAMGTIKWSVIEKLKEDISIEDQPVQILKKVPLLTIFSDTNNSQD